MRGPVFIVLEGIDGSGTSTQITRVARHLETAHGRSVHATAEPSGGPIGRLLREILMGGHALPTGEAMDGATAALLFAADRQDHLRREIEPALAAGKDVISDRYLLSSLAYQAEEADREWVTSLGRGLRRPDLTLLLDVPATVAADRRRAARRVVERYDAARIQERVAARYRELVPAFPGGRIVDASGSIDEVSALIFEEVDHLLRAGA